MSYNTEEIKKMMANELKREDTFEFECKSSYEVLLEYTNADIGKTSHVPVVLLRQRLDGSCRLMTKGKCSI